MANGVNSGMMQQMADGTWREPENQRWQQNKGYILKNINAGTATPSMQNWFNQWQDRMGQNGAMVNRESGQVTQNPTTNPNAPPTGVIGSEQALRQGLNAGLASIDAGVNAASGTLSPYMQGGSGAFNYQAALSGAMGDQAQADAYARFQESPGQSYLRDMGEKALLRNASATGGLGGGNVLQELQRHGIGLAAQDFDNAFNRLGSLSQMGYGASNNLAGMQGQAGFLGGEMAYGTGNTMAAGRTRAGERIADNLNSTTSALAGLQNQQGAGMADTINQQGGNLANILMEYGKASGLSEQQLMTILGNIATGSASTVAGLPGVPGVQQQDGNLTGIGNLLGGAGTLAKGFGWGTDDSGGGSSSGGGIDAGDVASLIAMYSTSDPRLKTNITPIGQTPGGNNLYTWDWNAEGKAICGDQPTFGVMADEVPQEAVTVGDHGYLMVDYTRIH